jgi:2-isopropylmalate synthase
MAKRIQIYDTSLRDGSQGEGINFSLEDKLAITRRLDEAGIDYVEGGYPLSNEKDAQYFASAAKLNLKHATVCAFGMTRRKGIKPSEDPGMKALLQSGAKVLTIVGKTSSFHVTEVLRVSLEENLAMIRETIEYLRGEGRQVFYDAEHFFDGWKLDPDYAKQTIQAAARAGAGIIVLCDTNGGTMPEELSELVRAAQNATASANVPVGIHTHNDCDLGVANALAAVEAGAMQVQGTINGIGERCGNCDLVSVIGNLRLKKGDRYNLLSGPGIKHLTELSRFVYETANMSYRANQAFVGSSAFAHKGGMHVHAVARAASSYEHIDPETVGNERRILVSELSGRANIQERIKPKELAQDAELVKNVLARIVELENRGYQFEAADASFDLLVWKLAGKLKPHFERLHYHVNVEGNVNAPLETEATVKLRIGDEIRHEVSEGDGPVNALDAALRKALLHRYPQLEEMTLVDYKVRVINSEAGTAAGVRVVIESKDDKEIWGTVGVSENVIEASWLALCDSFEYMLSKG